MTDYTQTSPRRPLVPAAVPGPRTNSERPAIAVAGLGAAPAIDQPRSTPAPFTHGPIGNIAKGIAGVMAEVGTINKGGWNAFHKYHYARMEDLLVAITPLMGKHGIVVIQHEVEIKTIEGNRVAVTYEFSIIHSSGEMWPERPRFTGMSNARDSKGGWDDKAINKCHTSARKYFLLALFQVPSGDFEDDQGDADANQRQDRGPVPGPKTISEKAVAQREQQVRPQSTGRAGEAVSESSQSAKTLEGPHKIVLGQGTGADQWANAYIRGLGTAKTPEEIKQWDSLNDNTLEAVSNRFPSVYAMIEAATARRLDDLGAREAFAAMPDPKADPQEAMNWVASQLQQLNTYEAAEAFWNQVVAPHEQNFDALDWEMLMAEWKRTETRLAPDNTSDTFDPAAQ